MFRNIIGRLCGFKHEILQLHAQMKELGYDSAFGILNRSGLLTRIRQLPRRWYGIAFIDLDSIGEFNRQFGYEAVNAKIRAGLRVQARSSDLIGRWYSGDELLLVACELEGVEILIERLRESFEQQGITFCAVTGCWNSEEGAIETAVAELASEVLDTKAKRNVERTATRKPAIAKAS